MKKVTIGGKITTTHATTMAWKRIKIGTFVSIPHPNNRVLCTSQDQMPPRMPPDPLRSHIIQIKSLINYSRMAVKIQLKSFTSMPPPGPSRVHFRFCDVISQIWIIPSKLPDASNCPSVLNAKLETESLWPAE